MEKIFFNQPLIITHSVYRSRAPDARDQRAADEQKCEASR
jgi:hypothetical protein